MSGRDTHQSLSMLKPGTHEHVTSFEREAMRAGDAAVRRESMSRCVTTRTVRRSVVPSTSRAASPRPHSARSSNLKRTRVIVPREPASTAGLHRDRTLPSRSIARSRVADLVGGEVLEELVAAALEVAAPVLLGGTSVARP
jgi:hypothetical protein